MGGHTCARGGMIIRDLGNRADTIVTADQNAGSVTPLDTSEYVPPQFARHSKEADNTAPNPGDQDRRPRLTSGAPSQSGSPSL